MKRKRRLKVKKKRVVKKRRVWSDGTASASRITTRLGDFKRLRTLAIVVGSAAVILLTTLYFVAKLPMLETYIGGEVVANDDTDRNTPPRIVANEMPSAAPAVAAPPTHSERNVAQENLQASVSGNFVTIVNEGEIPIHLTKLVLNQHYRVAGCDTDANLSSDPGKPPDYSARVDQVLQIGDNYKFSSQAVCGAVVAVEVHTDQGNAMLRLSPHHR